MTPPPDPEQEALAALVRRHRGNLSACAGELKITRQAFTRRLAKHDLTGLADQERATHLVSGPRTSLGDAGLPGERASILAALAATTNAANAADRLGIGRRTLFRRCSALAITQQDVADARAAAAKKQKGRRRARTRVVRNAS